MNVHTISHEVDLLDDIQGLAEMLYSEAGSLGVFDFEYMKVMWSRLLLTGVGEIFLVKHAGKPIGFIGVMVAPGLHGDFIYAQEMMLYIDRVNRGGFVLKRLATVAQMWAKHKNARFLIMSEQEEFPVDYSRLGYRPLESSWVKEL